MTQGEQALLLQETTAHDDPRNHTLYSMALGTGLGLQELLGLNVGDVSPDGVIAANRPNPTVYPILDSIL